VAALSILQVAISGRAVRERVTAKVDQIPAPPARLGREVGMVLHRARTALTHGIAAAEPAAPEARLEQIVSLESSREAPRTHADDGVTVVTIVALGAAPLWPATAPGDARALEAALQTLAAVPDAAVTRLAVHLAPEAGQSFDTASLSAGYPHLPPLSAGGASQVRCRFCGVAFDAYRTSCPSCGGAVER
jgi:hypothetical protein